MSEDKKLLVVIYVKQRNSVWSRNQSIEWYYFVELQKIHFLDQTFNSNKEIFVAYKKVT